MKKNVIYGMVGLLTFVIILVVTLFVTGLKSVESYVTISINPEVELMLDANNKVIDYLALNEDADILMSDLEVIGLDVLEATDLIIESATLAGYIDEYTADNAILVKTINEDEEDRLELEEKVMANLKARLEEKKVYAVLAAVKLGDALKAEAETFGISNGKMLLIEEALVLNTALVKEELVDMSIKEIQALIKTEVKKRHDLISTDKEELKTLWQTKKEEIKNDYKEEVDALKENFKKEISNYESLTPTERVAKIKEVIESKKAALENKLSEVKEEVRNYIENGQYNSVADDVIEDFRSAIKNRGN